VRSEDLLKPDVVSEAILLGAGALVLALYWAKAAPPSITDTARAKTISFFILN
jgi:hypothetical protein